jgi:hypothetical protein
MKIEEMKDWEEKRKINKNVGKQKIKQRKKPTHPGSLLGHHDYFMNGTQFCV